MKIDHVTSSEGDWEGIYIDGKLKVEGHSFGFWEIMEALNLEYKHQEVDFDELEISSLPYNLEDLG